MYKSVGGGGWTNDAVFVQISVLVASRVAGALRKLSSKGMESK
jgi:hypothetical protein